LNPSCRFLACPAGPYISSCQHTIHSSCWEKHVSSRRVMRGDYFMTEEGEVQCPVCRSLSNCAIPMPGASRDIVLKFGERVLDIVKISDSSELWLNRLHGPWRPFILTPPHDVLAEAALIEIVNSISICPGNIISRSSMHALLISCLSVFSTSTSDWAVWDHDPTSAASIDVGRLFLESRGDREFAMQCLALRWIQLGATDSDDSPDIWGEMSKLAVFIAWVIAAVDTSLTESDLNRIAYLPESPYDQFVTVENVLGLSRWKDLLVTMRSKLGTLKISAPPAIIGGLVPFIDLPTNYVDLIKKTLAMKCKSCNTRPSDPAICLLCGDMVCLDSDCCRGMEDEGECTQHARTCGAGQGIFILPFASIVLAVAAPRNCVWDGPSEDIHGEPDSYLKRSIRLTLSQYRLEKMKLSYTRGTIAVDIVRQNDATGRYVPRRL
jgi:hypothetical protein